jgi:plasmid stabilization system protein ParE
MKVFWATAAQRDRADIIDYISQDSPRRYMMSLLLWV